MFTWLFPKRNNRPLDEGAIRDTLERNVWQYRFLDAAGRERVGEVVARLVAEKDWAGGSGFRVTDEMRVTVSGVAALVTVGLDRPFFFPRLKSIILYPSGYRSAPRDGGNLIGGETEWGGSQRLGESWQAGPIVLSWRHAMRNARNSGSGHNLVLHELAHHLDGIDGMMDGSPVMSDRQTQREWEAVVDAEYHRLVGQSRRGEAALLDRYGATNRAEFFAVSVECFFERPHEMRERHTALYELMAAYFHQSPADWLPDQRDAHPPPAKPVRCRRRCRCGADPMAAYEQLGLDETDRHFTRGVELLDRGQPEEAVAEFTAVLDAKPDDSEAYGYCAVARLQLGDDRGALADAQRALDQDDSDMNALLAAADAEIALGGDRRAKDLVKKAIAVDSRSASAWLLSGVLDLRAGAPKQAKRALRKATGLEPHDAEAHYWLGRANEELNNHRAAERSFLRSEQLDPEAEYETAF